MCPWCYLGKRRLETALGQFQHRDEVEVLWHSFELDPGAPQHRDEPPAEHLQRKYGMSADQVKASWARLTALAAAEGLDYRLETTQGGSTLDAHRLIHLAREHGLQDAVKERLMRAYFSEGAAIGDPDTLARLGVDAGLPADEVAQTLAGDRFTAEVRDDEHRAQLLGITGVPFFVIDERYGVSGAQSADHLLAALNAAWAERVPATP